MRYFLSLCLMLVTFCQASERQIKAVIFDFDGTLIDTTPMYFLAWEYALNQQGHTLIEEEFWSFLQEHHLIGLVGSEFIIADHYSKRLHTNCEHLLLKDVNIFCKNIYDIHDFPLIEPTTELLRALAQIKDELNLKIGLASANSRKNILRLLIKNDLLTHFDTIVSADDLTSYQDPEGVHKPKPYAYLHAAKLLGASPEECIAIEDSRTGVTAAVAAGCFTIAVPNKQTLHEDLSSAHLILSSLKDMTPPLLLETAANH